MPEPLLKRLWEKRVLWFVRMQPTAIAKLHMADLATKYTQAKQSALACLTCLIHERLLNALRQVLIPWV